MIIDGVAGAAYLIAALLFIMSLGGLSKYESARFGVGYGITGMITALAATTWLMIDGALATSNGAIGLSFFVVAMIIGGAIGLWRAAKVEMTGMPELIALLHSFGGLAAVIVGWNGHLHSSGLTGTLAGIHHGEIFIGIFIDGVTFTGSIVAFLKPSGRVSSKPLMLPGKNILNLGTIVVFFGLTTWYVSTPNCHCSSPSPPSPCCWDGAWSPPSAATCRSSSPC